MRRAFVLLCVGAYDRAGRHIPADGLPYGVYNLAGDEILHDDIVKAGS
jgi:hypothetical protein